MLVYLVAVADALAYLSAVPVCAAFWLSAGEGLRFGVGLAIFERRFALRRAEGKARRPKPEGGARGRGGSRLARALLLRLRLEELSLQGRLGLGNAAATALACGALTSLVGVLSPRADRASARVSPAFDADAPAIELRGMIKARVGQIIIAAARSGMDDINGRIAQWIDTRWRAL